MPTNFPYKQGDIVEFRLKAEHPANVELIDNWGNTTYVNNLKGQLKKGQSVECRIREFKNNRPIVEPVGRIKPSGDRWSITKEEVLALMSGDKPLLTGFVSLLLSDLAPAEFESAVHKWITRLAQQKAELCTLRGEVSDLLEYTDFLFRCTAEERRCFTERITLVIELVGYYIKADELTQSAVLAGDEDSGAQRFIQDVFRKLSTSGYIYHPKKNIYLLICLFTLHEGRMHASIKEFFDIIRKRDISDWQGEDYYPLLVKVLELYVTETDAAIDRQLDQTVSVQNILQALSLIILLDNGRTEDASTCVNRSRLLRYASYLNHTQEEKLVELAWANLTARADKPAYTLSATADSDVLAAILANNRLPAMRVGDHPVLSFTQRNIRFSVLPGGAMTLRPVDIGRNGKPVLPAGLLPWHDMQIILSENRLSDINAHCDDIFRFMQMWKDIELALFAPEPDKAPAVTARRRTVLDVGDAVHIYVTHKDDKDRYKFHCRMAGGEEGKGYIYVYPDIVAYKPNAGTESFLSDKGRPLLLPAVIKEINEDGSYVFSCRQQVQTLQVESVDYRMHMISSIGSYSPEMNRYSAVTKEGFSVSIPAEPDMERLQPFRLVEITGISQFSNGSYLDGSFITTRDDEVFDIQDAFHRLMLNLSGGTEYVDLSMQAEKEAKTDDFRPLTAGQVLEMMKLIDRKAVYETDYIRSYNYLAWARILATMLGNEERIRFYQGRMDLLVMLHDFAVNDRVDEERLQQLERDNGELFRNNVQMHRRLYQLKLVGSINHPEKNDMLYTTSRQNGDEGLRLLASLVLAHNLLREQRLYAQADYTHAYIKQLLRLKSKDSALKCYGVEDSVTEFKTSLVYPAGGGMTANLPAQTQVVMRVVASMLNSGGGSIYLGVNDCGYGVGIEEDLRYPEFSGDRDKYTRYITDAIRERFGNIIIPNIAVSFDMDNQLPVCIIRVCAFDKGVMLDGKWPVRKNSQTIDLTDAEYRQIQGRLNHTPAVPVHTPVVPDAVTASAVGQAGVEDTERSRSVKTVRQVPTAVFRYHNMPVRYDMAGYINLKENDRYSFSEYFMGGVALSQAVYPEDDMLVLVYADGFINRVPVSSIVEKTPGREYVGVTGADIAFAALAGEEDFIYLRYQVKNRPYVRVIPLADLEEMGMSDKGRPFTQDPVDMFDEAEIIPAAVAVKMRLSRGGAGNGYSADHKDGKYLIRMVQKELKL